MHKCVSKLTIIGSDNGLSPALRQAIIHNLNQSLYIFIHENALENAIWKKATIFSWPQCVNTGLTFGKHYAYRCGS